MLAGTNIYNEMIGRGASAEDLERYNLETRKGWEDNANSFERCGKWVDIKDVIKVGSEEDLNKILNYLDICRLRINGMMKEMFFNLKT